MITSRPATRGHVARNPAATQGCLPRSNLICKQLITRNFGLELRERDAADEHEADGAGGAEVDGGGGAGAGAVGGDDGAEAVLVVGDAVADVQGDRGGVL